MRRGLGCQEERGAVAVEGPGASGHRHLDRRQLRGPEEALPEGAVREPINKLDRAVSDGVHRDDGDHAAGLDALQADPGFEVSGFDHAGRPWVSRNAVEAARRRAFEVIDRRGPGARRTEAVNSAVIQGLGDEGSS